MNLGYNLAYQFTAMPSSDMMNDLARIISLSPNEAIAGSLQIGNLRGYESLKYFGGGATLYLGSHGASCKLSANRHLLSMVPCNNGSCSCCCIGWW
jgi:hypothetical protein